MSTRTAILRHVMAPTFDRLRGTATMKRLAHLEQSQWWSLERIQEQQSLHLGELIRRVYQHVPYYRRIMAERDLDYHDITRVEDLRKLPPLTKADIRIHAEELLNTEISREQLQSGSSGGTTGERLKFYSTRQERLTYAYARWALVLGWTGVHIGEPHVALRQLSPGAAPGILTRTSLRLQQLTTIDTMTVVQENLDVLVHSLRRIQPRTVFSYPSALAFIASFAMSHGLECPNVPAVCLGGEFMHERQRAVLTSAFGSVPFIRYGSNELYEVAGQCEVQDGLHILAEDFVLEVVDDAGAPVPRGQTGRLLITSLHNDGMPFIRYAPGDIVTLRDDVCPCGRGLPLMDVRIARTRDFLVSPTGERTAAIDIDLAALLPAGTVNYQLAQDSLDHFQLRVVTDGATGDEEWARLKRTSSGLLSSRLGAIVGVEVQPVADIDMNLSGKRLAFVSEIARDSVAEMPDPKGSTRMEVIR